MSKIQIMPVIFGRTVLPESMAFQNGDKDKVRDIVFQVFIVKSEKKLIMIDAGCETMRGFVMRDFIGTVQALENANISPDEITDILITHAHHDHIECIKYFKNAVIHIQEDEYESGKRFFTDELKVNTFKDEYNVCENIKLVKIGGHSVGSCVVELEDDDTTYVISGDECYLRDCIEKNIPTGCSVNLEKSKYFIQKYSGKEYTVLLCHEEIIL